MEVTVAYTDGSVLHAPLEQWPSLRGEGVDWVEITSPSGVNRLASASLYWLYREGMNIVVGCGSLRYDPNPLTEIVIGPDGSQQERSIMFCPDMLLCDVKLGHWWPGKPRPLDG